MTLEHQPHVTAEPEGATERHEVAVLPIDFGELDQRRGEVIDEMLEGTAELSHPEWLKLVDGVVERFKTELIAQSNRFSEVFTTENGSFYFVTSDGACLRLQMSAEGDSKIKPILMKHIFIDDSTTEEILAAYDAPEKLIGRPLTKQSYAVGMRPFEIGIQGFPTIQYDESAESLTILGDNLGTNYSGMHVGHKVTEIIR